MTGRLHSPAFSLLSDFDRRGAGVEAIDVEARLKSAQDDGYRQGHADGRTEAESDAELMLVEASTRHAEHLEEERLNWQRECADILLQRLESAAKSIERTIEDRVAALLRPWLVDRLRVQALQDLERAISRALVEGAKIHIEAPAEIVQHLRERLPSETFQIGYSESADADIRAYMADTQIEANISAWVAELEAISP